jgi:hypothetical protein
LWKLYDNLRIIPTLFYFGFMARPKGLVIQFPLLPSIVIEIPNKSWEILHLIQMVQMVLKDHLHCHLQTVLMDLNVNQTSPNLPVAHRLRHEHQTHHLLLQVQQR